MGYPHFRKSPKWGFGYQKKTSADPEKIEQCTFSSAKDHAVGMMGGVAGGVYGIFDIVMRCFMGILTYSCDGMLEGDDY